MSRAPLRGRPGATGRSQTAEPAAAGARAPRRPYGLALQPKLALGPASDRFEAEADRAADHVTAGQPGRPALSRLPATTSQRSADAARTPTEAALEDDEAPLQRSPAGGVAPSGAPAVPATVEAGVRAARGGGQPLPPATRAGMEAGFGRDLGRVRLHDDARAHRLSDRLGAHAFTTGRDIFFARGAWAPGTEAGRHLLAHELAHVGQQTGPGTAPRVQRLPTGTGAAPAPAQEGAASDAAAQPEPVEDVPVFEGRNNARIDTRTRPYRLTLPALQLPKLTEHQLVKGQTAAAGFTAARIPSSGAFDWAGQGARGEDGGRDSRQLQTWETDLSAKQTLRTALQAVLEQDTLDLRRSEGAPPTHYLRHGNRSMGEFSLIGTEDELMRAPGVLRPPFSPAGRRAFMQVDHYFELQLGGQDVIGNLWLLDSDANQTAGDQIKARALGAAEALVDEAERARPDFWSTGGRSKPSFRGGTLFKWPEPSQVVFTFLQVQPYNVRGAQGWLRSEIEAGAHVTQLRPYTRTELRADGLLAEDEAEGGARVTRLAVFSSATSAFRKTMTVSADGALTHGQTSNDTLVAGLHVVSASYSGPIDAAGGAQVGQLTGRVFLDSRGRRRGAIDKALHIDNDTIEVPIKATPTPDIGAYFDQSGVAAAARALRPRLKQASPLAFEDASIGDDFVFRAGGTITADNPLFPGVQFRFGLERDTLFLDADLPTERLNFGAFEVTEAALGLGVGEDGLFFRGSAAFRLRGVGEGTVTARGAGLAGTFRFDLDAFDPAELSVGYADGVWSGAVDLGIRAGTIPGVTGGTIRAELGEAGFSISGTVDVGGPGLPAGAQLNVAYSEETGVLTLGGRIEPDTSRMPGITGAHLELSVTRDADGVYSLSGAGAAQMSLAGISGAVTLAYRDGYLDATATAQVNRPPLTGRAAFNLSNRPVDAEGQPLDGPPLPGFRVWGEGSASVQFGRYITGTVGIRFLENGEVELAGTVALPPEITLIDPLVWRKDLLDFPEVRFPIIGLTIPVINRSVGIFGFVGGGIDAALTVGPGNLVDTQVTVVYNPDRPEDMSITGTSAFVITADAEIGLTVRGGIGAGLAIVEAVGEIGIRGALGLGLTGRAELDVAWTPQTGLDIGAAIEGQAQPRFTVTLIATARVTADVGVWEGDLWSESWNRTLAEIGPDAVWSARLPMGWSETGGLDLSLDNLEVRRPPLDLRGLAMEVFDRA